MISEMLLLVYPSRKVRIDSSNAGKIDLSNGDTGMTFDEARDISAQNQGYASAETAADSDNSKIQPFQHFITQLEFNSKDNIRRATDPVSTGGLN
ncbi:hypothetical protein RYH80_04940 [Halobaculum sp. MBLA0147]|uniref:hypothetical protein n=1 Tax=Halobaculum sp. MBLA0147 TaxID=3079934 RepID=UPI003523876C